MPVHPSNVMITKINETASRKAILERRGRGTGADDGMSGVD